LQIGTRSEIAQRFLQIAHIDKSCTTTTPGHAKSRSQR